MKNTQYKTYRKSFILKVKDFVRNFLKDSYLGRQIYPFVQRCWRAYAIPKRQKRLQNLRMPGILSGFLKTDCISDKIPLSEITFRQIRITESA